MKAKAISIIVLVLNTIALYCPAQKPRLLNADSAGFIHVDTAINYFYVPTVVEQGSNKPFIVRHIMVMHHDCIYNGLYKPKQDALRLYGAENLMRIVLKPSVKVLSFSNILKKYRVDKKYIGYPVFINQHQLYPAQPLMATENVIDTIEVIKDKETGKIFISIITNN